MTLTDVSNFPDAPIVPPKYDSPFFTVASIGKVAAEAWLVHNRHNRNMRRRAIQDMARDIDAGGWILNGEAIKLSRPLKEGEIDGVPAGSIIILDGQHRLRAIASANRPVVTAIVFGLDPKAQDSMDSGIKRTIGDVLRMAGETHSTVLGSVLKRAHAWQTGDYRFSNNTQLTKGEAKAFLEANPTLRRSAQIAVRTHHDFKVVRQSIVAQMHWVFSGIDPTEAAWFFQRLADGAELPKTHPIMSLRKRLTEEKLNRAEYVPDWKQVCYYIRAWNAVRDNRLESYVLFSNRDNDTMPMPH